MNIKIRSMVEKNVSRVLELGRGQKEFTFEHQSFWLEDQLTAWCQSNNDLCLVAEINNIIVGFSLYAMHAPTKKVTWENLYVASDMRNMGIATKLIKEGLEQIRKKGYSYVMGCVNATNKDSFIGYVEKFGFKRGHEMIWIDKVITATD